MRRQRGDDGLRPPEAPVEPDTLDDREGTDGLQYVTGVPPYRSLDEMLRAEEEEQREARDAEDRMEREARERVEQAHLARELSPEDLSELGDEDSGAGEDDVLNAAEQVLPLDVLEGENPSPDRYAQDVDAQGRSGDPDRDWQGQPFSEEPRSRPSDGSRRRQ